MEIKETDLLYSSELKKFTELKIYNFEHIVGVGIKWSECYDEHSGGCHANCYILTHENVNNSSMLFKIVDGVICVEWKGEADTDLEHFEDVYPVPFELFSKVDFVGYKARMLKKDGAICRLNEYIDIESVDSGVECLSEGTVLFKPKAN